MNKLKETFTDIFNNKTWIITEDSPISGPGSSYKNTKHLVESLPNLFKKFDVKVVLDGPCGDYTWMKAIVDQTDITYIGVDIVDELIAENRKKADHDFRVLDITSDVLPNADLMICRDCLFHFDHDTIIRFIKNLINSDIKYLLTSNFEQYTTLYEGSVVSLGDTQYGINKDIELGDFTFIHLFDEPYNFPKDVLYKVYDHEEYGIDRYMCMWSVEQLKSHQLFASYNK